MHSGRAAGFAAVLLALIYADAAKAAIYVVDSPIAGSGMVKRIGPDGSVTSFASLNSPQGIAAVPGGLYVTDPGSRGVFHFDTAGSPSPGAAPFTTLLNNPANPAVDPSSGTLYITNGSTQIMRIDSAGAATAMGTASDLVQGLAVDAAGNVYAAEMSIVEDEEGNFIHVGRIERWTRSGGRSVFFQAQAVSPVLQSPGAMAFSSTGDLFVADRDAGTIERVSREGAASAYYQWSGTRRATGLAFDADGTLYASVLQDHKVVAFAAGSPQPTDFATTGLTSPAALAADPPLTVPEPTSLALSATILALFFKRPSRRVDAIVR